MVEEDQGEKGEDPNLEAKEEGERKGVTVYKEMVEVYHREGRRERAREKQKKSDVDI